MEFVILGSLAFVGKYLQNDGSSLDTKTKKLLKRSESNRSTSGDLDLRKEPIIKPVTYDDTKSRTKLEIFGGRDDDTRIKKSEQLNTIPLKKQHTTINLFQQERTLKESNLDLGMYRNDMMIKSELVKPLRADHSDIKIIPKSIDQLRAGNNKQVTYKQPIMQGKAVNTKRTNNFEITEKRKIDSFWSSTPYENQTDIMIHKRNVDPDYQTPLNQRGTFEPLSYQAPAMVVGSNALNLAREQVVNHKSEQNVHSIQPTADPTLVKETQRQIVSTSLGNRKDYSESKYHPTKDSTILGATKRQDIAQTLNNRTNYTEKKYVGATGNHILGSTKRQDVAQTLNNRTNYVEKKYVGATGNHILGSTKRQDVAQTLNNRTDYVEKKYVGATGNINPSKIQRGDDTYELNTGRDTQNSIVLPIKMFEKHNVCESNIDIKKGLLPEPKFQTIATDPKTSLRISNDLTTTMKEQSIASKPHNVQSQQEFAPILDRSTYLSSSFAPTTSNRKRMLNLKSKHRSNRTNITKHHDDVSRPTILRNQFQETNRINTTDTEYGETIRSLVLEKQLNQTLAGSTAPKIQDVGDLMGTQRGVDANFTTIANTAAPKHKSEQHVTKSSKLDSHNLTTNPHNDTKTNVRTLTELDSNERHNIIASRTTNAKSSYENSAYDLTNMEAKYTSRQDTSSYTTNAQSAVEANSQQPRNHKLKGTKDTLIKLRKKAPRGESIYLKEHIGESEVCSNILVLPDYKNLKTLPTNTNNPTMGVSSFSDREKLHTSYFDTIEPRTNRSDYVERTQPSISKYH